MLKRLTISLAALVFGCAPLMASPPLMGNIIGKQASHGPGSRGFLPTCSGSFSVENILTHSNTFTSWGLSESGSSNPVVTSGAADPNGGTTAYQIVFPTVSAVHALSVIDLPGVGIAPFPNVFSVWARVVSGATNGTIWATMSSSTTFARAPIPNDGNWHKVNVNVPTSLFGTGLSEAPQIGINLFDTGQTGSTGSITIDVWNASNIFLPIANFITTAQISGPLATTGTAVTATLNIPCPLGVGMRNFNPQLPRAGLNPSTSNPIITANTNEIYQSGGISNPYNTIDFGGFHWAFANSTNNLGHGNWMSFSLYKSRDFQTWTEDTTNAPYLQTFGSIFAVPAVNAAGTGFDTGSVQSGTLTWAGTGCSTTNPLILNATTNGSGAIASATYALGSCTTWPTGTTWTTGGSLAAGSGVSFTFSQTKGTGTPSYFQLHPAWLPNGCTISSAFHPFCVYYGGESTTSTFQTNLAWSNTINGVYTPAGCTGPGVCSTPTPVIPVLPTGPVPTGADAPSDQNLPTVINVGGPTGTDYIFTAGFTGNKPLLHLWTSPSNPTGTQPPWTNIVIAPLTGEWNAGAGLADPMIYKNKCGNYELFYTAYNPGVFGGKNQAIGYAVSNSPSGPWWKETAAIIPYTSPMYFSAPNIGDTAIHSINGRFIWLGNYDNATSASNAVAATMQDACAY
jgi:hypothetical protein